jgi:hypothetical protein
LRTKGSNGSRAPLDAGAPLAGVAGAGAAAGAGGVDGAALGEGTFGTGRGVGNFGWDWAHAAAARRLAATTIASPTQPDPGKPGWRIIVSVMAL